MGFGIVPQGVIGEAYSWRFDTVEKAKEEAERLSIKYNIDIFVVRLLGFYHRHSEYKNVE